jgi:hypothetical protein
MKGDKVMSKPMSEEQLWEIEARAAAATPGEWEYDECECELRAYTEDKTGFVRMNPVVYLSQDEDFEYYVNMSDADAEFIGHAREDVPALVAEVRRLRAELAQRWIPVSERLPEDELVIVHIPQRDYFFAGHHDDGWWNDLLGLIEGVTHWTHQPLPPEAPHE